MEHGAVSIYQGQLVLPTATWLAEKEAEVKRGEEALEALKQLPTITKTRISRVRQRIAFLKRFVALLKDGFIPIPRMAYEALEIPTYKGPRMYLDKMPVGALQSIAELKGKFDNFGLVRPTRHHRRDPILIGILRHGHMEEHFIIGWWRPDMAKATELW